MMLGKRILAGSVLAVLCCGLHASEAPLFDRPLVQKVNWNCRSLIAADMNGDGLEDLVLVNNDEAKIDLLLQKPEGEAVRSVTRKVQRNRWEPILENAPFQRESIVTGDSMYAVTAADIDADGLTDLIYTSKQHPLGILYQGKDGGFDEPVHYDGFEPVPWTTALRVVDLQGDGQRELLLIAKRKLIIFPLREGERSLPDPKSYPLAGDVPYGLDLADINGDGRLDIFYELGNEERPFRVRLQDASGGFSRSYAFDLKLGPDVVQFVREDEQGHPVLAYLQSKTGLLETFTVRSAEAGKESGALQRQPLVYSSRSSGDEAVHYAFGDFDADGLEDVVAADASSPEIRWFRATEDGFGGMQDYPALAHISQLAAGRIDDAGAVLVILSERDRALAMSRYEQGRFSFPGTIALEGDPLATTFADMDGDGIDELLVTVKDGSDYFLRVLRFDGEKGTFAPWRSVPFDSMRRSPWYLLARDLDGDNCSEVLVLVRRESARMLRNVGGDTLLEPVDIEASVRGALLDVLQPEQVAIFDVLGDQNPEILVASTGYVRALGFSETGELVTRDQFNTRNSEDKVRAPAAFDIDRDDELEVVLYDPGSRGFQILERDQDGVYRYDRLMEAGTIEARNLRLRLRQDSFVLTGNSRFWDVPVSRAGWELDMLRHYETDLENVRYSLFLVANFLEEKPPYFIMVDGEKHLLELLAYTPEAGWKSVMHFVVFDENMHFRGQRGAPQEPKEVVVADLNADGLRDMALLVHDRVLVYPQFQREAADASGEQ